MFGDPLPHPPTAQDWETEYQCCKAFNRPPRTNLKDTPFYPWMPKPKPQFRVSFKLGFQ